MENYLSLEITPILHLSSQSGTLRLLLLLLLLCLVENLNFLLLHLTSVLFPLRAKLLLASGVKHAG